MMKRGLVGMLGFLLIIPMMVLATNGVTVGAGVMKASKQAVKSDFQFNLRSGSMLGVLKPWLGVDVVNGNLSYGWGGFGLDIPMGDKLALRPNVALGFFIDDRALSVGKRFRTNMGLTIDFKVKTDQFIGTSLRSVNDSFTFDSANNLSLNLHYTYMF